MEQTHKNLNLQNHSGEINFIKIKCKKCSTDLTKAYVKKESVTEYEGVYLVKPYFLKTVYFSNERKMHSNAYKSYLYDSVICSGIKCEDKIGRYIQSCTKQNWHLIENVMMAPDSINM